MANRQGRALGAGATDARLSRRRRECIVDATSGGRFPQVGDLFPGLAKDVAAAFAAKGGWGMSILSGRPGQSPGPDASTKKIEDLLTSASWQARLAEARALREKVLEERARLGEAAQPLPGKLRKPWEQEARPRLANRHVLRPDPVRTTGTRDGSVYVLSPQQSEGHRHDAPVPPAAKAPVGPGITKVPDFVSHPAATGRQAEAAPRPEGARAAAPSTSLTLIPPIRTHMAVVPNLPSPSAKLNPPRIRA